jgi:RHS repeat-associated protein
LAELRGSVASYYEADDLGSITSLSSSNGTLANTYTYDSFGNLTASTGTTTNPFQYTGREFDPETNTFFYRARYYDANAGRFTGEDPVGFRGGANFYTYVRNSPLNFLDPTGMSPLTPWKDVSTRPCNIDEYETCANMCGSRGVESCKIQITFKLVRWKDGKSLWKWVDGPMSCSCNEPKPDCPKAVRVLSWATLLALIEEYGWGVAFAF